VAVIIVLTLTSSAERIIAPLSTPRSHPFTKLVVVGLVVAVWAILCPVALLTPRMTLQYRNNSPLGLIYPILNFTIASLISSTGHPDVVV